jgi:hypothetical protein
MHSFSTTHLEHVHHYDGCHQARGISGKRAAAVAEAEAGVDMTDIEVSK